MATLPTNTPITPIDSAQGPSNPTRYFADKPTPVSTFAEVHPGIGARGEPAAKDVSAADKPAEAAFTPRQPAKLIIRFDDESRKIVYEFRSAEDGSLLRQFPAEDLLKMVESGNTTPGQLIDGNA